MPRPKIHAGDVTELCAESRDQVCSVATPIIDEQAQRRTQDTSLKKFNALALYELEKSDDKFHDSDDTDGEPCENTDSVADCALRSDDEDTGLPKGSSMLDYDNFQAHEPRDDTLLCRPTDIESIVGTLSSGETNINTGQHGEQYSRLTELRLPNCPFTATTACYLNIKQSGKQRLRDLIEVLQAEHQNSLIENVSNLWSCWDPFKELYQQQNSRKTDENIKQGKQLPSCEPRRIQCGWFETIRPIGHSLIEESSNFFKKMVRRNTQMVQDIVVPNIFDVNLSIDGLHIFRLSADLGGRLQQLLLPFDLVRWDDATIDQAPAKIVELANSYLRSLRRSDISLTRASMNVPCIWNMEVTIESLAKSVTEQLLPSPVQPTSTVPSSVSRSIRIDEKVPEKVNVSEPRSKTQSSQSNQICSHDKIIVSQANQPSTKLTVVADDDPFSTDYFLSDQFLQCRWSKSPVEADTCDVVSTRNLVVGGSDRPLNFDQFLQQIARPALWDLMRKKLLQVNKASFQHALDCISLEGLKAIIVQHFQIVKRMCMNPSAYSSVDIVEACTNLRQASWLHTLRAISIGQKMTGAYSGNLVNAILARILDSAKYRLLLGSSNKNDLLAFSRVNGGNAGPLCSTSDLTANASTFEENQPSPKKQKVMTERMSVRVLCSIEFLEQDKLLDELCTEQQIFFIERNLPSPIDILVDESNCICVVTEDTFQAEDRMREFIFSLACLQLQLQKCWIIIAFDASPSAETENRILSFCTALVQFRIDIKVLTSFSCEETGNFVRAIVDECADVALNEHRILPRLWFERPFLLDEESQFERFLVSTRILNHYAAQSLLHKISLDDLFSRSVDDLKVLIKNAVTGEQLELLWRVVQQDHGLK